MRSQSCRFPCCAFLIVFNCLGCTLEGRPDSVEQAKAPGSSSDVELIVAIPEWTTKRPLFACWRTGIGIESTLVRYAFYSDGTVFWKRDWSDWSGQQLIGNIAPEAVRELEERLCAAGVEQVPQKQVLALHMEPIKTFAVCGSTEAVLFYDESSAGGGNRLQLIAKWKELQGIAKQFLPRNGKAIANSSLILIPEDLKLLEHPDGLQAVGKP